MLARKDGHTVRAQHSSLFADREYTQGSLYWIGFCDRKGQIRESEQNLVEIGPVGVLGHFWQFAIRSATVCHVRVCPLPNRSNIATFASFIAQNETWVHPNKLTLDQFTKGVGGTLMF